MRIFGTKKLEPTDEDLTAAARLSAVAARHRNVSSLEPADAARDRPKPRKKRTSRNG